MTSHFFSFIRYSWRNALGRCLVSIPLHRWSSPRHLPAGWRRKSRPFWCAPLLPLGNLYLRLLGAPSEVLSTRCWLEREALIAATLGRDVQSQPGLRALDMRLLPGESLSEILRGALSQEAKLDALRLAAAALRQLHAVSLSHGDATCNNVVVDRTAHSAAWIDFDTRHRAHLSATDRRADDVRTLLLSSAVRLPDRADANCAESVFQGYGDEDVAQQVRQWLLRACSPSVFHVAQAPLPFARFHKLRRLIVNRGDGTEIAAGFQKIDASCAVSQ